MNVPVDMSTTLLRVITKMELSRALLLKIFQMTGSAPSVVPKKSILKK